MMNNKRTLKTGSIWNRSIFFHNFSSEILALCCETPILRCGFGPVWALSSQCSTSSYGFFVPTWLQPANIFIVPVAVFVLPQMGNSWRCGGDIKALVSNVATGINSVAAFLFTFYFSAQRTEGRNLLCARRKGLRLTRKCIFTQLERLTHDCCHRTATIT